MGASAGQASGQPPAVITQLPGSDSGTRAPDPARDPVAQNSVRLAKEARGCSVYYAPVAPDLRPKARRAASIPAGPTAAMARIGVVRPRCAVWNFPALAGKTPPRG